MSISLAKVVKSIYMLNQNMFILTGMILLGTINWSMSQSWL